MLIRGSIWAGNDKMALPGFNRIIRRYRKLPFLRNELSLSAFKWVRVKPESKQSKVMYSIPKNNNRRMRRQHEREKEMKFSSRVRKRRSQPGAGSETERKKE